MADGALAAETVYFRSNFTLQGDKKLESAYFVFTADDYGTVYVNGVTVLDIPNQTDIWKTGNVVNITDMLKNGEKNIIAAKIVNSSVGYAGLVGKLYIKYTDGTTEEILTNRNWRTSKVYSSDFAALSFDDSGWNAPDQYVTYGNAPWSNQCIISNKGDRAAVLLRKEFTARTDISEATVYMSGIGYSILSINGKLADDCFFDPCNTQYNKTVLYRTFDVTKLIAEGSENAIAVELGNGFYKDECGVWNWHTAAWKDDPKLLFYMIIRYADGSRETVLSNSSWKATAEGPTTFNSIYYGEYYDARLEKDEWLLADYDDSSWQSAIKATAPTGVLECQLEEPVRKVESFKPTKIEKLSDGSYIVYCPEMVAGFIKLAIKGADNGDTITITYGEKLNSDGSVQKLGLDGVNGSWWPEAYIMTDKYTAKGEEIEFFEPKFSYKGFEYIQIYNYKGNLTPDDITIYRTRNDVEVIGYFDSSNETVNGLHKMMLTTVLNNLQGKPTDTPVWEKNGWLGDFNVGQASMNYNYDMRLMTENFIEIIEDCFEQYKLIPPMVPTAGWNISDNYVWSSVYILGVSEMYKSYGSLAYVEEQYETMKSYATNTARKIRVNGWVCPDGQLGDWVSPMGKNKNAAYVESPSEGSGIVGTAMIYMMYNELIDMAKLLGKDEDISTYEGYLSGIYEAFNAKFYNAEKGYYETTVWTQYGTRTKFRQTSQIMPLAAGLVPDEYMESVVSSLISDIEKKGNHLDTGCVGTKFILPVLTDLGYNELAYTILTQTTYPSWGFMLDSNSTSLWEMWETTTRSRGHYFLGTYEEWLYSDLAGITGAVNGYETFTIKPNIVGDLTYVTSKINTVRGELESSWTLSSDGVVTMKVRVPFGATATVICPSEIVSVNGEEKEGYEITLGSGAYEIICKK